MKDTIIILFKESNEEYKTWCYYDKTHGMKIGEIIMNNINKSVDIVPIDNSNSLHGNYYNMQYGVKNLKCHYEIENEEIFDEPSSL